MAKLKIIEWFLRVFILLFVWSIINTFLALFHSNSPSKETITTSRNCLHFSFSIVECNFFRINVWLDIYQCRVDIPSSNHFNTRVFYSSWHLFDIMSVYLLSYVIFLFIISSSIFSFFDWRIMPKNPITINIFSLLNFNLWSDFFPRKKKK